MSDDQDLQAWMDDAGHRVRRRVRLLMLLDAADYVVIAPVETSRLHALAFLADVLSPIYDLAALSGRILKRRVGPYFPELQWELDRLVGMGLVDVFNLKPIVEETNAYLDASFALNWARAQPIVERIYSDEAWLVQRDFFRQLAGALASLPDQDLDDATRADVTWETGLQGTVIDYAEWRAKNYSTLSVGHIAELTSEVLGGFPVELSPGAKVSLYVQYLRRVANG